MEGKLEFGLGSCTFVIKEHGASDRRCISLGSKCTSGRGSDVVDRVTFLRDVCRRRSLFSYSTVPFKV
jgi:hypothetical protein